METLTAKELGLKITSARKMKRLTQRELAEKLNVHPSMVTHWEKGQTFPRGKSLESIAQALDLSTPQLFELKPTADPRSQFLQDDIEMKRSLELLALMGEEDRKLVKQMIAALAFRHQVQSLGQAI